MIPTTELGRTKLVVSSVGLGLAALGRPGYINLGHAEDLGGDYRFASMEDRAHRVLQAAWDEGVRYFDVARSYGRAEEMLRSWLDQRRIRPQDVVVGSKWGYTYTAGWQVTAPVHEVKEHTPDVLERQLHLSSGWLGMHLDVYQVHSATLESGVLRNTKVINELARLRASGVAIGLTLSGPAQAETLRQAMEVKRDSEPVFSVVQATWNLLEPSAEAALAEAHAAGMGVIVKEALANGRLTARNADPDFAPKLAVLGAEAERLGTTVDALALAAALAQPWAHVVLSGAVSPAQLRSNLAALGVAWDDEAAGRLGALAEEAETYWKIRGELEWN
jgi:aryl-alcohol dehydrogenase-like predicted oxidoreductase